MTSFREALLDATRELQRISSTPKLDAELLLRFVLQKSKEEIICSLNNSIDEASLGSFKELIIQRAKSEPVAYLVGQQEFFGLPFKVDSRVLIPRPETELLVEFSLDYLKKLDRPARVLDLGTGSGCIAISLAKNLDFPVELVAVDKSPDALELAAENAKMQGVQDRITFLESDWFSSLNGQVFDLIVSNPPYVECNSCEVSPETDFEPKEALFSGENGLDDIEKLVREVPQYLREEGVFVFEHGSSQRDRIEQLLVGFRSSFYFLDDLAALPRACVLQL